MGPDQFPKIRGGAPPSGWLIEHTALNSHAIGPSSAVLAEWRTAGLTLPDLDAMRRYRLARLRAELARHDVDGILLHDPLNIRYATDTTNMSIWTMHNQVRYAWVPTEGPVLMWEYSDGEFLSAHSGVVDEIRPAISLHPFYTGDRIGEVAGRWAADIRSVAGPRIAVDILSPEGIKALEATGAELLPGQRLMENARVVKGPDEILALRCAVESCRLDIADMRSIFHPGVTEVELWAQLQHSNLLRFGEWVETRLLSSGERTNPWYQEASTKPVAAGELMGFDTDLIGPFGMCVDISRTWLCGDGKPSAAQHDVHSRAVDMIEHNTELFVPGATYREITERLRYPSIDEFNGYTVLAHGTGICDEYPSLYVREKWDATGFDGVIESGNIFSIESFVGRRNGKEGVKLEQQILVTDRGPELLTGSPSLDL